MTDHICPACKGDPAKPAIAFFNTGEDYTKHYAAEVTMSCRVCDSTGVVSDEINKRWYSGRLHRDARVQRGETLFHAAQRLRVSPAQLSAYEHGFADLPTAKEAASTMACDGEDKRAYLVRGIDLQWEAKRGTDGSVICKRQGRNDAAAEARRLGYHFLY